MSAAKVITSSMSNVAVLAGTEGSLAGLIRYLAPILGWSIEFDSGSIIVIKPQSYKGGQALLYRIDDRASRGGAAPRVAEIRAYESMSDINTGAGLVGPTYIHKSFYANTASQKYYVIGDQYGMFLVTQAYRSSFDNAACTVQYFGFLNGMTTSDIPVCGLFGSQDTNAVGDFLLCRGSAVSSSMCFIHKNRSGSINKGVAMIGGCCFQLPEYALGSDALPNRAAYPYNGQAVYSPPFINDGAAGSIRGYVPGLYAWHHSINTEYMPYMYNAPAVVSPLVIEGKSFVNTYSYTATGGANFTAFNAVVDIGEGFRP